MHGLSRITITKAVKGSKGERQIMSLLPFANSSRGAATWSSNRTELVGHFTGWSYIGIRAIAEVFGDMSPQVAKVLSGASMAQAKSAAYQKKGWERRAAIDAINASVLPRHVKAKALATIQQNEELELVDGEHPLMKLMRNPNGPDVAWTFFYKIIMYLELTGSAYVWIVPNGYNEPTELHVLPSHWCFPIPGVDAIIAEYEVRPMAGHTAVDYGWGWFGGGTGKWKIPADQIIQISYPNPSNFFDGYSPLTAIATWIQVAENIDNSRVAHFYNGAFPGVFIEIDKDVGDLPIPEMDRLKSLVQQAYGGVKNTGKSVILRAGIKLVKISNTPAEMDYNTSADQLKTWTMAAHKVGASQVGLAEQTTFASMVASSANFYQGTIRPKATLIGQVFTEKLAPLFETGDERLVIYWPDKTPSDPDFELRKWQAALQNGCATPNEFRTHVLDIDAFEHGGDDPLVPMTMSPLPLNTGEDPEMMPIPAVASQGEEEQGAGETGGEETSDKDALTNRVSGLLNGSANGKH